MIYQTPPRTTPNWNRKTQQWLEAHCDCHVDHERDERGWDAWIEPCGLHQFAEEAAKFLNERLKNKTTVALGYDETPYTFIQADAKEIEDLLDNYGLLDKEP